MTIIVFLIDTSASMNQRTFIGARPTLLDIAKGAVENFVKLRQRNPESRFDRYMLFTSEEFSNNIKAGWKENLATFMNELKNIKATGLSIVGPAIKNIFDVLNINRMQSGIDTYGSGRSPFFLEPSVIICITDGGKLSSTQGVQEDIFPLPKSNQIPGADLTSEIFRWDQRLFGLVLRLTGTPTPETMGLVPSDNSPLDKLCEQTGGRSYAVRTHRMFQQCIESLVQKVQSGVVINFEKIGPDPQPIPDGKDSVEVSDLDKENQQLNLEPQMNPMLMAQNGTGGILGGAPPSGWTGGGPSNGSLPPSYPSAQQGLNASSSATLSSTSWHNCRKMIYVPRPTHRGSHGCFWPIPESYWSDSTLLSLPARSAHPNLKFTCTSQEPMVIDNLPFDKYELEPSPLTQYILSRKQPTVCWQVFIANSSKHSDVGHPFGYLKASTTKPCVNLFVMPYNYPVLLPLLDDLFKTHRLKPAKDWRQQFENYLRTMPPYYASPLKRALDRMGVSNILPDKVDSSLGYLVTNNLKKLKNQAKVEYEKICGEVEKRVTQNMSIGNPSLPSSTSSVTTGNANEGIKVKSRRPLSRHLTSNHLLKEKLSSLRDQVPEYKHFSIAVRDAEIQPQTYRNPFDIARSQIIDQLARMRANFLQQSLGSLLTEKGQDQLHCKPISQMGNYQDYLKKMNPPLREIESAPVRQHMFGNPFKIDKRMSMMVDEADVDLMGAGGPRGAKRPSVDPLLGSATRPNKRRKGPIPPDFTLQRLVSPCSSPAPSPPSSPHCGLDEMGDITPPLSPIPHLQEGPTSPHLRPDTPLSPLPGLAPSPAVITPGYLHQLSPPSSPVPYPREDIPVYPGALTPHLIVNGDADICPYPNDLKESDSEEEPDDPPPPPPPTHEGPYPERDEGPPPAPPPPVIDYSPTAPPTYGVEHRNGSLDPLPPPPPDRPPRVASPPEAAVDATAVDSPQTEQANKTLLLLCYKEVKRPGREFGKLFAQMRGLQGSAESRSRIVKAVIHEALRFKRHSLARILTQRMEEDLSDAGGPLAGALPPPRSIVLNGHNR